MRGALHAVGGEVIGVELINRFIVFARDEG